MTTTIKSMLDAEAEKRKMDQIKSEEKYKYQLAHETNQLDEARNKIAEALEGFDYKEDVNLRRFELKIKNRNVFVVYKFENHEIRYSDDTSPVDQRLLTIDIGYFVNVPIFSTSLDSFIESFIRFLKSERLV